MTLRRIGWGFALAAVAVRLVFWRHTDRVWEDSLITILHAENALAGLGLTHYKPDEPPIHGFTSPLGVLVPLAGEWLRAGLALDAMRAASVVAAFATVRIAARMAGALPQLALGAPLAALACGYLALEHHQVLWGMAGMETQLVTCALLASILCLAERRYAALGACLGLCMLARPDMALWAALAGAWLGLVGLRARDWKPLAITVAVALLLYLPWVAFAWNYYGSPIPNTVLAKSAGYTFWWQRSEGIAAFLHGAWQQLWWGVMPALGPAYAGNGTGFARLFDPGWIAAGMGLAVLASLAASVASRARETLLLHALLWTYLAYFVFLVPVMFGWYAAPIMAVAVILAAHGVGVLWRLLPRPQPALAWTVTAAYLAVLAGVLPITFRGERNVQRVEDQVRVALGRHLRETAPKGATVGGEPLGYVGYHSRLAYYDFPGLASRRVVEFMRASPERSLQAMLAGFQPDYLVLRDFEVAQFGRRREWLDATYRVERRFEAHPDDRARMLLPERNIDTAYTLYRKREPR